MTPSILLVDDDRAGLDALGEVLADVGARLVLAEEDRRAGPRGETGEEHYFRKALVPEHMRAHISALLARHA